MYNHENKEHLAELIEAKNKLDKELEKTEEAWLEAQTALEEA